MLEQNSPIAIIPSECFRWRARVHFIESFRTRAAAMDYAFQHGCNLIVERNEGRNSLYDVLQDPDWACTTGLDLELLKTEDVLVEPEPASWTRLLFQTVWHLCKRFSRVVVTVNVRVVVPLSRRSASIAEVCLRNAAPFSRRAAALAIQYLRKAVPLIRRAAVAISLYCQEEVAPSCRSAARQCWWSNGGLALRRTWHRHCHGTPRDLARRFAAISSLHAREISDRVGVAARGFQWSDVGPAVRIAWGVSLLHACDSFRWFVSVITGLYLRKIAPFQQRTGATVSTYLREADVRARYAARSLSDGETDPRSAPWAVVVSRQSNPSHLRS